MKSTSKAYLLTALIVFQFENIHSGSHFNRLQQNTKNFFLNTTIGQLFTGTAFTIGVGGASLVYATSVAKFGGFSPEVQPTITSGLFKTMFGVCLTWGSFQYMRNFSKEGHSWKQESAADIAKLMKIDTEINTGSDKEEQESEIEQKHNPFCIAREIVDRTGQDLSFIMSNPIRKSFLLYGEPGTGKSNVPLLVGGLISAPVYTMGGAQFVKEYAGQSSSFVYKIQEYMKNIAKTGTTVFTIDEIDSILPARNNNNDSVSKDQNAAVNAFLTMLDDINKVPEIILIGTSNDSKKEDGSFKKLDSAYISRTSEQFEVKKLSPITRKKYLGCSVFNVAPDATSHLAKETDNMSFREMDQYIAKIGLQLIKKNGQSHMLDMKRNGKKISLDLIKALEDKEKLEGQD
ncbi:MAG: ATP-binding protein [Candidatus Babeliaceae bacterium]|jgi:hypothetical protein